MEASFEWNPAQDAQNQLKHGVAFAEAQQACLDPQRLIARDNTHSAIEDRYYCFGQVACGILTVRFTYRNGVISNHRRWLLAQR